jgi:hypothetical protein
MEKKEKIGCPITLGEYEEIVRKEKENKDIFTVFLNMFRALIEDDNEE